MRISITVLAFLLSCLLVFLNEKTSFAASVTYTKISAQETFLPNDELVLHVNLAISASEGTSYYLRGVFYKDGSSNYCGLTWNGSTFYSGPYSTNDGWKSFLKVIITDNSWQGDMKVKIDSEDSGCRDSGSYKFKVQRFTESGSGSFDPQDSLAFIFTLPTPTSIPTPTTKPTATPHPTSTPKPVSVIKTSSQTASVTTNQTTQAAETDDMSDKEPNPNYTYYESTASSVLGEATNSAKESPLSAPTPTINPVRVLGSSSSFSAVIFSTIGIGFLSLCGILAYRIWKTGRVL